MQHTARAIFLAFTLALGCDSEPSPEADPTLRGDPAAPVVESHDFALDLDDIAIDIRPDGCTVEALNRGGEIIGRLGFHDRGGDIKRVSSEYADGLLVVDVDVVTHAVEIVEQTLEPEQAERRARLIEDMIGAGDDPQEFDGWWGCGAGVVLTVAACVPSPATIWAILRCPITAGATTCKCVKAANDGKAKPPCGKEKK